MVTERNVLPSSDRGDYLALVDGLRGLAALAVLLFHYGHFYMAGPNRILPPEAMQQAPGYVLLWPFYEFGLLAVQVFWLISGFVFAHVYCGRAVSRRAFWVSRIARLYPLHLLTLLVVVVLQMVALARLGYTPIYGNFDIPHFVLQLGMASDWLRQPAGYAFNGPIWSVSVEVLVYGLFWLLRPAIQRTGLPLALALVAAFFVLNGRFEGVTMAFDCATFLFAGVALSAIFRQRAQAAQGIIVLSLLAVGCLGIAIGGSGGREYLVIPGFAGAAILLLAARERHASAALRRACTWLGENTYGIYLWHFPIQLAVLLVLLPSANVADLAGEWWFLAGFVAAVICVARISYTWFERPMRAAVRDRLRAADAGRPVAAA